MYKAIRDEKSNKGTSVDIKKDENDIPGINKYKRDPKNAFLKYVIDSITIKILRRDKGFCSLDITGPAIFGSLFCKFFNVNEIKEGMNEYRGLDNKKYKILVPFKQLDFRFFSDVNNSSKKMVQIKSKNHLKHIYNNDIKKRYDYQWRNNQIFN